MKMLHESPSPVNVYRKNARRGWDQEDWTRLKCLSLCHRWVNWSINSSAVTVEELVQILTDLIRNLLFS